MQVTVTLTTEQQQLTNGHALRMAQCRLSFAQVAHMLGITLTERTRRLKDSEKTILIATCDTATAGQIVAQIEPAMYPLITLGVA
jgi:hypothetical protein